MCSAPLLLWTPLLLDTVAALASRSRGTEYSSCAQEAKAAMIRQEEEEDAKQRRLDAGLSPASSAGAMSPEKSPSMSDL